MYAKISLSLQNRFNSKHSLALYELFVDYYNVKLGFSSTPEIGIEQFRKLLGLTDNEYKTFKALNKEIHSHSEGHGQCLYKVSIQMTICTGVSSRHPPHGRKRSARPAVPFPRRPASGNYSHHNY